VDKVTRDALNNLAAAQRGLISVTQARQLGLSPHQVMRAASAGYLRRVRRGVYALASLRPSSWDELVAAVLAAGPAAVVSHGSAATVHRLEFGASKAVELTLLPGGAARPPGVAVHRASDLTDADIVQVKGLSVTSPCRTLVDLAHRLGANLTEKALDEGLIQRRWTVAEMSACLSRARRNLRGRARLERLLALRAEEPSAESALEALMFRCLAPLAPFRVHHVVTIGGVSYNIDAAWPDAQVGAEIAGRSHRVASRSAFDRERRKLNVLAAAGWRIAHLTAVMSRDEVLRTVRSLLPPAPPLAR
jgi:very-short-patch-repair endonuclease